MQHTHNHFVCAYTPDGDDEPFMFEAEARPNPFESDDPEVAYHEYLAERFSQ